MGIEYEIKFRATAQAQQEICDAFAGAAVHYDMHTVYYDTPSCALSARHYTLRKRMENETAVCTIKAPVSQWGRGEWEVNCQRIEDAIEALCRLGAPQELPQLVREGLVEVCGARFHRIAKTLQLDACAVELAIDRGVLTGGGKEIPLCEIEVEFKSGDQTAMEQFALQLGTQYGLVPEKYSKFRRALALYKGEYHGSAE